MIAFEWQFFYFKSSVSGKLHLDPGPKAEKKGYSKSVAAYTRNLIFPNITLINFENPY